MGAEHHPWRRSGFSGALWGLLSGGQGEALTNGHIVELARLSSGHCLWIMSPRVPSNPTDMHTSCTEKLLCYPSPSGHVLSRWKGC